jgi:hypothetical protein
MTTYLQLLAKSSKLSGPSHGPPRPRMQHRTVAYSLRVARVLLRHVRVCSFHDCIRWVLQLAPINRRWFARHNRTPMTREAALPLDQSF